MFGYNAQLKRCAIDGAKTLRVQRWSATTGVKLEMEFELSYKSTIDGNLFI